MGQLMRLMKVVVCEPDQAFREIIRVDYPGRDGERGSQRSRRVGTARCTRAQVQEPGRPRRLGTGCGGWRGST
jgi:hypothetical protein